MSVKAIFLCNACGAEGTIKLDGSDHEIEVCPCCANTLDIGEDLNAEEAE